MKFTFYATLVLSLAATLGCQKEDTAAVAPPVQEIEVTVEPEDAPEAAPEEFVIDVRSQEEWDAGHLSQAILIPHTEISERIAEVTEDKSAKLVLY